MVLLLLFLLPPPPPPLLLLLLLLVMLPWRGYQVVRDGRDIAFSGNQSPVTKFYRQTYSEAAFNKWSRMPEVGVLNVPRITHT